jgi:hypothetical protein
MQTETGPVDSNKIRVTLGTPCSMRWSDLKGTDSVRHCQKCQKSVYNSEKLTTAQILEFVKTPQTAPCLMLYRRRDGTLMTADCKNKWAHKAANWTLSTGMMVLYSVLFLMVGGATIVTVFGDNIRALFGESTAGALAGEPIARRIEPKKKPTSKGCHLGAVDDPHPY